MLVRRSIETYFVPSRSLSRIPCQKLRLPMRPPSLSATHRLRPRLCLANRGLGQLKLRNDCTCTRENRSLGVCEETIIPLFALWWSSVPCQHCFLAVAFHTQENRPRPYQTSGTGQSAIDPANRHMLKHPAEPSSTLTPVNALSGSIESLVGACICGIWMLSLL